MKITYHKDLSFSGNMFKVPHSVLNKEIQNFINEHVASQLEYLCSSNGFYFFIYLGNGDRIDVQLLISSQG